MIKESEKEGAVWKMEIRQKDEYMINDKEEEDKEENLRVCTLGKSWESSVLA
jgi:hypothetical protein